MLEVFDEIKLLSAENAVEIVIRGVNQEGYLSISPSGVSTVHNNGLKMAHKRSMSVEAKYVVKIKVQQIIWHIIHISFRIFQNGLGKQFFWTENVRQIDSNSMLDCNLE